MQLLGEGRRLGHGRRQATGPHGQRMNPAAEWCEFTHLCTGVGGIRGALAGVGGGHGRLGSEWGTRSQWLSRPGRSPASPSWISSPGLPGCSSRIFDHFRCDTTQLASNLSRNRSAENKPWRRAPPASAGSRMCTSCEFGGVWAHHTGWRKAGVALQTVQTLIDSSPTLLHPQDDE